MENTVEKCCQTCSDAQVWPVQIVLIIAFAYVLTTFIKWYFRD